MRKEVVMITGANGEIGHGLIKKMGQQVVLRNRLYTRYFEERFNV